MNVDFILLLSVLIMFFGSFGMFLVLFDMV